MSEQPTHDEEHDEYVPEDDAVIGRVIEVMKGDRQFDRAQTGGKMSAALADGVEQKGTNVTRHLFEFGLRQCAQVSRCVNPVEQGVTDGIAHRMRIIGERHVSVIT